MQNQNKLTARKWYTDVDFNLTPHPSSGDLILKTDKEAVKRSVRNIMLTNNYERPFKPNFGANLRGLLFELADDMTKTQIRRQIVDSLQMLEPRVSVENIYLTSTGHNALHVNVHYGVVGIAEPQELEVILERIR
tara:strand:- start:205 stop:609 length:405 start_codon:yes stop_codon:yes gene_type:complete